MGRDFPLISVIIPVYKVEQYLDICVESVLAQTYKHLEIILVDDGSPDNCPAMCDAWAERDSRIKVIHKANGGASTARNIGLNIAKGEYIGFVDSDDYIAEDMYSCMLEAMQVAHKKIACCKSVTVRSENVNASNIASDTYNIKAFDIEEAIDEIFAFRMGTSFWRRLFHASVFDEIRFPEGEINEEYPLLIPVTVKAGGTVLVEKALYYYRDRSDSVTGTLHRSLETLQCVKKNLMLIKQQLAEYELDRIQHFPLFVAKNAYFLMLSIVKNYDRIEGELKKLYESCYCMVKENRRAFLRAKDIALKDKLLFVLLLSGLYKKLRRK